MDMIRRIFQWIFKSEVKKLKDNIQAAEHTLKKVEHQYKIFNQLLNGIDVSVDVHEYHHTPSWAVISLQGVKTDYIKFIDLGDSDLREISQFLRKYEKVNNIKIDTSPQASPFLKMSRKNMSII